MQRQYSRLRGFTSVSMAEGEVASINYSPIIDLTPIFQAVIGFLAALITYRLIPWIQANTTPQQ